MALPTDSTKPACRADLGSPKKQVFFVVERRSAATLSGSIFLLDERSGGIVAALLNHRLIAVIPFGIKEATDFDRL
jgi:hypothetical protein